MEREYPTLDPAADPSNHNNILDVLRARTANRAARRASSRQALSRTGSRQNTANSESLSPLRTERGSMDVENLNMMEDIISGLDSVGMVSVEGRVVVGLSGVAFDIPHASPDANSDISVRPKRGDSAKKAQQQKQAAAGKIQVQTGTMEAAPDSPLLMPANTQPFPLPVDDEFSLDINTMSHGLHDGNTTTILMIEQPPDDDDIDESVLHIRSLEDSSDDDGGDGGGRNDDDDDDEDDEANDEDDDEDDNGPDNEVYGHTPTTKQLSDSSLTKAAVKIVAPPPLPPGPPPAKCAKIRRKNSKDMRVAAPAPQGTQTRKTPPSSQLESPKSTAATVVKVQLRQQVSPASLPKLPSAAHPTRKVALPSSKSPAQPAPRVTQTPQQLPVQPAPNTSHAPSQAVVKAQQYQHRSEKSIESLETTESSDAVANIRSIPSRPADKEYDDKSLVDERALVDDQDDEDDEDDKDDQSYLSAGGEGDESLDSDNDDDNIEGSLDDSTAVMNEANESESAVTFITPLREQSSRPPSNVIANDNVQHLISPSDTITTQSSTSPNKPGQQREIPSLHLMGFGKSSNCRLGLPADEGGDTIVSLPSPLPLFSKVITSVASGRDHTLALSASGNIFSWGLGHDGRLGLGTESSQSHPTRLTFGPIADSIVVSIACGECHSLATTKSNQCFSWGRNYYGRLGHGDSNNRYIPELILGLSHQQIITISAGVSYSLATTVEGKLYSWGYGGHGQLGHGDQKNYSLPKLVQGMAGKIVTKSKAAYGHTLCITASGELYAWGSGRGLLGLSDSEDRKVPTLVDALQGIEIIDIACGYDHSLALSSIGSLYSWGNGGYGQLGAGDSSSCIPTPELINSLSGQQIVSISAGEYHSICITAVGSVFSWGHGGSGALGHGDLKNRYEPESIEALKDSRVVSVSAGASHTMLCVEAGSSMWELSDVTGDIDEEEKGLGYHYASLPSSSESITRPGVTLQQLAAEAGPVFTGEDEKDDDDDAENDEEPVFSSISHSAYRTPVKVSGGPIGDGARDAPSSSNDNSAIQSLQENANDTVDAMSPLTHSTESHSSHDNSPAFTPGGGSSQKPVFSNVKSEGYGDRNMNDSSDGNKQNSARKNSAGKNQLNGSGGYKSRYASGDRSDWVDEGEGALPFSLFTQNTSSNISIPNSRDLYSRETLSKYGDTLAKFGYQGFSNEVDYGKKYGPVKEQSDEDDGGDDFKLDQGEYKPGEFKSGDYKNDYHNSQPLLLSFSSPVKYSSPGSSKNPRNTPTTYGNTTPSTGRRPSVGEVLSTQMRYQQFDTNNDNVGSGVKKSAAEIALYRWLEYHQLDELYAPLHASGFCSLNSLITSYVQFKEEDLEEMGVFKKGLRMQFLAVLSQLRSLKLNAVVVRVEGVPSNRSVLGNAFSCFAPPAQRRIKLSFHDVAKSSNANTSVNPVFNWKLVLGPWEEKDINTKEVVIELENDGVVASSCCINYDEISSVEGTEKPFPLVNNKTGAFGGVVIMKVWLKRCEGFESFLPPGQA
jgi:alpha-tubulin suppressor-like RCC1 family protein